MRSHRIKTRAWAALLSIVLLASLSVPALAVGEPSVTASAAVVLDYDTGEFLYTKDADTMRVPASMTKIMTAYIIYRELAAGNITKDTEFYISDNARSISYDSSYPTAVPLYGSTITVGELLGLIMVPSASACCIVAAENISGSEAEFVARMNQTADELGIDANYENCHGARVHYVTARSVALLISTFIREYPDILNYTSLTSVQYNGVTYSNTNKLLSTYYYEGADGFKTGTITASGYCLSATAVRNGRRVITVVMNSSSTVTRHTDSQKLLDYGFEQIALRDEAKASAQVTLSSSGELRVGGDVTVSAVFSGVSTPFSGTFTLSLDGQTIGTFNQTVQNGTVLSSVVNLDESYIGAESAELSLSFSCADGTVRQFTQTLAVSDAEPPSFRDIAGHWAESQINAFSEAGLLSGYDDGTFRPNNSITRAEFAVIAARICGLTAPGSTEAVFSDIAGHWAENEILALAAAGVINGYEDGSFRPDSQITRQEAAVIIADLLELESDGTQTHFTDSTDVADWASSAVEALAQAGILSGYEDGSFRPRSNITRAESVKVLSSLL